MALPPGTHLGPFEIIGLLGAGGMGEVHRARDSKLNRDVAIKLRHLVYAAAGRLWATRFDLARLGVVGDPIPVVDGVGGGDYNSFYSASRQGALVYIPMPSAGAAFKTSRLTRRRSRRRPDHHVSRAWLIANVRPLSER